MSDQTTNGELKELIVKLSEQVSEFALSNNKIIQVVNRHTKDIREIKTENAKIKESNGKLRKEIGQLKKEVKTLKENLARKSVVLHGIADNTELNKNLFSNILEKVRDIGICENQIDDIKRIGFNVGNRPVVINLIAASSRQLFFDNHAMLKNKHGIIVTSYTSKKEREKYNKLKEILTEILSTGKDASISKGKIIYNDKKYNILQATELVKKFKNKSENELADESDTSVNSIDSTLTAFSKKRERESSSSPPDTLMKQKKNNIKKKRTEKKESSDAAKANIELDEED